MKTAKEMFEDLGYKVERSMTYPLRYEKEDDFLNEYVEFYFYTLRYRKLDDYLNRFVEFYLVPKKYSVWCGDAIVAVVDMELQKAINKQLEELGWLDDEDN